MSEKLCCVISVAPRHVVIYFFPFLLCWLHMLLKIVILIYISGVIARPLGLAYRSLCHLGITFWEKVSQSMDIVQRGGRSTTVHTFWGKFSRLLRNYCFFANLNKVPPKSMDGGWAPTYHTLYTLADFFSESHPLIHSVTCTPFTPRACIGRFPGLVIFICY